MPGLYTHTRRDPGEAITANRYNGDHQAHVDGHVPELMDHDSRDISAMQATTAPGDVGSEVLATDFRGEVRRIRHQLAGIIDGEWYTPPPRNIATSGLEIDDDNRLFGYGAKIDARSSDFTIAAADAGKRLEVESPDTVTITVPANSLVALPVGFRLSFVQTGAGRVELSPDSNVDVRSRIPLVLSRQWMMADLVKRDTDEWIWIG